MASSSRPELNATWLKKNGLAAVLTCSRMGTAESSHLRSTEIETIYRRDYHRFARAATAILDGDADAAHDVVQESFATALRNRSRFAGAGSAEAWIWRICINAAHDHSRRERRLVYLNEPPERLAGSSDEEALSLVRAVRRLPERQRLAIFLRHYVGLSYDEIADVLGVSPGTVAASLHAAHNALRRNLEALAL
jgi:RNA polymerase sigma-70 factor, ECF subfamily